MESHPSKLVGSRCSENRYFDFEKLAEVQFYLTITDVHIFFNLFKVFQHMQYTLLTILLL